MNDHAQTDRKFANTLARGLSVLRAFRVGDNGLTHSQIAARTGLAGATITRLTYTLCELGYLSQQNGVYRLGPAATALGSVAAAASSFLDLADAPMQALADATGTLALVAVRDGDRMMLVKTWRPKGTASIWLEPGHRIPILGSSSGQAVMAALDQPRFDALAPDTALREFRTHGYNQLLAQGFTITPDALRYARTVNAVSAPYYAGDFGEPVAFSCGALPDRLTRNRMMTEVGPQLRDLVQTLERQTGAASALARRG